MKKKLILVGLLSFATLFGCTQVSEDVKASLPSGLTIETEDTLKHTGIYI